MRDFTLEEINAVLTDIVYTNLVTYTKDDLYKQINTFIKQWMIIYQIKNIDNGKIYIGSSGDESPLHRLKRHVNELSKGEHCNIHLQRAYNKYGKEKFEYTILELIPRSENLQYDLQHKENIEQQYIDKFHCADAKFGYNEATHVHGGFNDCTWETLESRTGIKPDQLKQYFDLLSNTDLTLIEIDKKVGLNKRHLAYKIYAGYSFRRLASEYTFRPRTLREDARGERNSCAKITDAQAKEIIQILLTDTHSTYKAIGDKFGISRATVRDIYKKRNWKHLTKDIDFPLRDFEKRALEAQK